ncbi:unnamed protein product [Notodromas monacha]|uniref:Uncharacterized protein n=1 Tax=Notodromas monacha TaxID=399045 RepID=A0A7R9BJS3_9CRUS|nr:unnamed protein product [Notodromas monacha]CAG0915663.1 unnamed protein product [Notodromas monacha]
MRLGVPLVTQDGRSLARGPLRRRTLIGIVVHVGSEAVLEALGIEGQRPSTAAQCVAHSAIIEFPCGVWPCFIPDLVDSVCKEGVPDSLKAACLEPIGYICQDIQPAVLAKVWNSILTAIVNGMRLPDENIRLAAVNALLTLLEFTQNNFAVKITLEAINLDTSELVLQGIEFWSTVCETKLDFYQRVRSSGVGATRAG